ncbi:unnamed protein product, partial [Clonostachys rosea]
MSWQEEKAFEFAAPFFNQENYPRTKHAYCINALDKVIGNILGSNDGTHPTSVDEYFQSTTKVFSDTFTNILRQKCQQVDALCGGPVSNLFIGDQPVEVRTYQLVFNTLQSVYLTIESDDKNSAADSGISCYLSNIPEANQNIFSPFPELPAPIHQISLRGPTLKEAWRNHPAIARTWRRRHRGRGANMIAGSKDDSSRREETWRREKAGY